MVEPITWECPACQSHKARLHDDHTLRLEECKWATADSRSARKRSGKHPRDPRRQASQDATAEALPDPQADAEVLPFTPNEPGDQHIPARGKDPGEHDLEHNPQASSSGTTARIERQNARATMRHAETQASDGHHGV